MAVVGTGRYLSDSVTNREGAFRFGQQITFAKLREQYYRDDIMFFLCRGLIEEAFKGLEIHDPETGETASWNDEFTQFLDRDKPELIRALAMERRDGRSLAAFLKKDTSELFFRSFTQDFYGVDYDKFGYIEKVIAHSRIHMYPSDVVHTFEGNSLNTVKELIYRRREKVNSGMSYVEPVWDIIIALYFVASHIAYHVARHGSGIKAFKQVDNESMPVDPLDDDAIDDFVEKASNFGGATDILWIPAGVEIMEGLLTSGGQVRWMEIFDVLLARISIYSGVPASRLKGLVPGQLEGAEVNEESYFDVLRDLQEQIKPFLRWYVLNIIDFYGIAASDNFEIQFNVREELSEEDAILLDMKKLDLALKYISAGVRRDKAFGMVGLEIQPSDMDNEELQKREEEREALLVAKNGKVTDE